MSRPKPFNVAIIGGGIIGITLAIGLRRRNVNVQIYERDDSLREYGAGVGLNPSACDALQIISPDAFQAYQDVYVPPRDPAAAIQWRDGFHSPSKGGWQTPWDGVSAGLGRAEFLQALAKYLPDEIFHFGKSLDTLIEEPGRPIKLLFSDGTNATADAVVGADGIGSRTRRYILGEDHPSARALYSNTFVYRATIETTEAEKVVSSKYTRNVTIWMGKNSHIASVPMSHGSVTSLTLVVEDSAPWPSEHKMVLPADREEVMKSFEGWSPEMKSLLSKVHEGNIDRWALFDLADNPLPYYAKGAIVLAGDSAHASTPHLGSGASTGIEDAAVLAELLGDERMEGTPEQIKAAFAAYNEVRLARGHWLTKASRRHGYSLNYSDLENGEDLTKIKELQTRYFDTIWKKVVSEHVRLAKDSFSARLKDSQ